MDPSWNFLVTGSHPTIFLQAEALPKEGGITMEMDNTIQKIKVEKAVIANAGSLSEDLKKKKVENEEAPQVKDEIKDEAVLKKEEDKGIQTYTPSLVPKIVTREPGDLSFGHQIQLPGEKEFAHTLEAALSGKADKEFVEETVDVPPPPEKVKVPSQAEIEKIRNLLEEKDAKGHLKQRGGIIQFEDGTLVSPSHVKINNRFWYSLALKPGDTFTIFLLNYDEISPKNKCYWAMSAKEKEHPGTNLKLLGHQRFPGEGKATIQSYTFEGEPSPNKSAAIQPARFKLMVEPPEGFPYPDRSPRAVRTTLIYAEAATGDPKEDGSWNIARGTV